MTDREATVLKRLGLIVFWFASTLYAAYVYTFLWVWFVVPVTGWVPLTLPMAWGLMLSIGYLKISGLKEAQLKRIHGVDKCTLSNKEHAIAFTTNILVDTMAWGMGWAMSGLL